MIRPDQLQGDLDKQLFVPFLGAGASSLRPSVLNATAGLWAEVGKRTRELWSVLGVDTREGVYLASLLKGNGLTSEPIGSSIPATPKENQGPLFRLQLSLIRLGCALTTEFGHQIAARCTACPSSIVLSAENSHSDDRTFARLLREGMQAASELESSAPNPDSLIRELLPARFIVPKLTRLGWLLLKGGELESAWRAEFPDENKDAIQPLLTYMAPGSIRQDEIQWIADLIWLTIRVDVPAYPTTLELATVFSLRALDIGPRNGDLALAADFPIGTPDAVFVLTTWLKFCQDGIHGKRGMRPPGSNQSRLHLAIACALRDMFVRYKRNLKGKESAGVGLPIALTTNFDRELELAFESCLYDYHVLYPGSGSPPGEPETTLPLWILKSVHFDAATGDMYEESQLIDRLRFSDDNPPIGFSGPLVIKLHGSPLDSLSDKDDTKGYVFKKQNIVLSEMDYLENIVAGIGEGPKWVVTSLWSHVSHLPKHFWFLGYSVSDWNIRLRLYEQLTKRTRADVMQRREQPPTRSKIDKGEKGENESRGVTKKDAVNKPSDPYRTHILNELDVGIADEDLEAFADLLAETPSVRQASITHIRATSPLRGGPK